MENRFKKKKNIVFIDYSLLFVVLFLVGFGLVMIYSTSSYTAQLSHGDGAFYLKKQIFATVLGLVALVFVTFFDYHRLKKLAVFSIAVSAVMVLLVLTPLGITANGARRWINVGISIQPAEIAKIGVIIYEASMIDKIGKKRLRGLTGFVYLFIVPLILALMVFKITSNLSSAIIILGIAILMWYVADPSSKGFVIAALAVVLLVVGVIFMAQKGMLGFRGARIVAWLDPESDATGVGFQTLQALYAIGSGGLLGKGIGQSMQKLGFVPEAQNDMIFSIICEELGLFGALAIMALFIILIWRCMVIASNARDLFGAMLVVGVMGHFAIQVILNIAVVTNTIPNTGISLPFISYGGTSALFLLAEIGLVLSVGRRIRFRDPNEKAGEGGV
ncbi:MAG: FtsW/RodA/SpoVE family cell cycle protein [Lachnospiraceae bacterium]